MTVEQQLIDRAQALISGAQRILITSHKSPDGDAVGSSLALAHFLRARGKSAEVLLPDAFADYLNWLPGTEGLHYFEKNTSAASQLINDADLIFCLDYNVLSRTGKDMGNSLTARVGKAPFILIDHHQNPEDFPEVLISDTSACSTAQLIYEFVVHLAGKEAIDAELGACIYCGIMTDSGSFRFPSVTPETHLIAAHLIEIGVDHADIHRKVYDTNLVDRIRLVGYALSEKLVVFPEFKTAYISLSKEELKRFNYRPGDTEGLVNQALSIEGVNMACFIREGTNEVKLSLRSQGSFRVNEFAAALFNGGGHINAAGGASSLPLEEVIRRFTDALHMHREALNYTL